MLFFIYLFAASLSLNVLLRYFSLGYFAAHTANLTCMPSFGLPCGGWVAYEYAFCTQI